MVKEKEKAPFSVSYLTDKEKEADELFLHKTISEIRNVERKTRQL